MLQRRKNTLKTHLKIIKQLIKIRMINFPVMENSLTADNADTYSLVTNLLI